MDLRRGDDGILPYTRILAAAIIPFLLVAFAVLYPWPSDTGRLFAWTIKSSMTSMVLGSAYLGGAYFFVRVVLASRWHTVKAGFIAVALFASLLGITTIAHWDKFNHHHVAFWLWSGLYFTTPFLVIGAWLANGVRQTPRSPDEVVLSPATRRVIGATGVLAVAAGLSLFLAPQWSIELWPWALTPLTARVLGAVLCLGVAGVGVFADPRWSTARLMVETEGIMVSLMLVAAARAHSEIDGSNPVAWLLLAGLVAVLSGSAFLYAGMSRRSRSSAP
jgi:hypothetical protein